MYIGVGNGSPWNQKLRSPGGGDNLYLSSIVAVKAETGEYVWHFQTTPGETWDYTATQPMMLADLDDRRTSRARCIMQAPKNGFFYVLDRATGEFISGAAPTPSMTWATRPRSEDRPPQGEQGSALRPERQAHGGGAGPRRRALLAADELQPADRAGVFPGDGSRLHVHSRQQR